ncbi:PspA-associated protein PspAA, partial [Streptomyces sp. NPDC002690]
MIVRIMGEGQVELADGKIAELNALDDELPKGTDMGPALVGLPGDLCSCPHWGYMLKGKL